MTAPFLQIKGLKKQYGKVVAIEDVSMTIEQGEFLTLLGPSGSGKSTTLYILAGFQDPTAGDILLHGKTLLNTPSHQRNIGMVFQRYTLFPHLSVGENVAFPLRVRRHSRAEISARVRHVLSLVRLEGLEDRMPANMSGGQQQRVALARALAYDPPFLLMDEPLSALDKKLREEIQHEIRRIHHETGVTILYVTHDQEEALRLSDRIAVFSKGVIDQIGTGPELYGNPATRFVAGFIGDSDFMRCRVTAVRNGKADIRFADDSVASGIPAHGHVVAGHEIALMLRPERIDLARQPDAARSSIAVTISDVTFLGNNTYVKVTTAWNDGLAVRLPYGHECVQGLSRGDRLFVNWSPDLAHIFAE